MSIGFINTNEHKRVRTAFASILDPYPLADLGFGEFDMLVYAHLGTVAIERKKVPSDLLSSLQDGRLSRELVSIRGAGDFKMLLLEGKFRYTSTGMLLNGRRSTNWSRMGIRNLLRSVRYFEGVDCELTESLNDTVLVVTSLKKYFDTDNHTSLRERPTIQSKVKIYPTKEEQIMWFYQGIPGLAVVRAQALYKVFPRPIDLMGAEPVDIRKCVGFSGRLSEHVYNFLRGVA